MSNVGHIRYMASWTLMQVLEAAAYLAAILGGLSAAIHFIVKQRRESIANLRKVLKNTWTNEGDISSTETQFITIEIENYQGDLIGSIHLSSEERPLDCNIEVKWFYAVLNISRLLGRSSCPVATVKLKLTGNENRLSWQLKNKSDQEHQLELPNKTILWLSSY